MARPCVSPKGLFRFRRGEPAAEGVLADDAGHDELLQIVFPARLAVDSGQAMSAERLAPDEGAGDGTIIDVEIADVERVAGQENIGER
jgi:hypothetical protein